MSFFLYNKIMKEYNDDNNENKTTMKNILENYFANPDDEYAKTQFKNLLISRVVLGFSSSEVSGAKFVLENIFD